MKELRRYPLSALAEALHVSEHALCVRMRASGTTEQDYRRRGLTERVADRWAVECGEVAAYVWPEMLDCAIKDEDQRTLAAKRARDRRYRQRQRSDPAIRQRDNAYRREYYAQCGEYERAQERRRYWARKDQAA